MLRAADASIAAGTGNSGVRRRASSIASCNAPHGHVHVHDRGMSGIMVMFVSFSAHVHDARPRHECSSHRLVMFGIMGEHGRLRRARDLHTAGPPCAGSAPAFSTTSLWMRSPLPRLPRVCGGATAAAMVGAVFGFFLGLAMVALVRLDARLTVGDRI